MKFNTDSMFVIGDSHKVCQDYCAGNETAIALSDGCSSSSDTDIGARMIVRSALSQLNWIEKIEQIYKDPIFDKNMFDVTCLKACVEDNIDSLQIKTRITGDGIIAVIYVDGGFVINNYIYKAGYPCYVSYLIDSEKHLCWHSDPNRTTCNIEQTIIHNNNVTSDIYEVDYGDYTRVYSCENIKCIALFSDGITSFRDSDKNEINVIDIVKELMAFKTTHGQFVTRRMSKFLKDAQKRGWTHYDDVSMAAIWVEQ